MKPTHVLAVSKSLRIALASLLGAGLFVTTTPVLAAIVTGAGLSVYSNPFDPNNDGVGLGAEATTMTVGAIGVGTVGVAGGWSQADLVSRQDTWTDSPNNAVRLIDNSGTATSSFIQYQAASSFNAGTIIGYQYVLPSPFNNATPYTMKLDGTTVQSGPGTLGTAPIQVTTLPSVVSASQLRVEFSSMSTYGPTGPTYAEMNEVMILPRRLDRIVPTTVTQTAGTSWFNSPSAVSDLDGYGWGGFSNPSLKLDFGASKLVSTLVVANFDGSGGPVNFNIKDDTNTLIGNVQLLGGAYGEFIPIIFATPLLTSFLTFDFTDVSGGHTAMREIMVFSDVRVPEPSSFVLGLLASVGLFRYRRRSAGQSNS